MSSNNTEQTYWWKYGVVYHIYPQSFMDSDEDGFGDLKGIIQKLDYLVSLGIDAVWLSPIYPSPMVDSGYDITDYKNINPLYGNIDDFMQLLAQAHSRGLKVIMDLVLNHTSDQHPWFLESRSSKNNPKRGWYIWEPPKLGKKPNNWMTNFGQSAWTYDSLTNEYYYHSFFKEQPDLNWRNPELRSEMYDVIRFWLELGVDGFRLDVINLIFKDKHLRKNPIGFLLSKKKVYNRNRPSVCEVLTEFRSILDEYPNKTSVGEIYSPPPGDPDLTARFQGNGSDMLHMAFDFSAFFSRWSAKAYYEMIKNYYQALPKDGWPCFVFSNHDLGRSTNRWMFSFHKIEKAKVRAMLLLTLKGTPFIYYGDEIGMENVNISRSQIHDMYGKLFYPFYKGRDAYRTPMQWNSLINAGFSKTRPWLPVHKNYKTINVENEEGRRDSILSLYRGLIQLRKKYTILQYGDFEFIDSGNPKVLSYRRYFENKSIVVILNFSNNSEKVEISGLRDYSYLYSISDLDNCDDTLSDILVLKAFEGFILSSK